MLALRDVAWGHPLDQPRGVAALDLHLALAGDIPDLHVLAKVPVVHLDRAAVRLGQKHVVDHGKTGDAGGSRQRPCRGCGAIGGKSSARQPCSVELHRE